MLPEHEQAAADRQASYGEMANEARANLGIADEDEQAGKDPSLCIIVGCTRKRMVRGLCGCHYGYHHRRGDLDLVGLPPMNPPRPKRRSSKGEIPTVPACWPALVVPILKEPPAAIPNVCSAELETDRPADTPPFPGTDALAARAPTALERGRRAGLQPPTPDDDQVERFLLRCCGIVVGAEQALAEYDRRKVQRSILDGFMAELQGWADNLDALLAGFSSALSNPSIPTT